MSHIYFGGSRHPQNINPSQIAQVVGAVVSAGHSVHVGCQFGADQAVISCVSLSAPALLHAFVVAPSFSQAPKHIQQIPVNLRARVTYSAGGQSAPMPARYLLRSIAAFQGCAAAIFFNPGGGSLAVAREALKASIPVFAFSSSIPAAPVGCAGQWVASSFAGFSCWQWSPAQLSLF